jgi:RNA polymerase sigma factor (sigma-70 family)
MKQSPTSDRTTDPQLLERICDWRDDRAWERFVIHYEPQLRAVCRFYGLSGASADDCCQQVWVKLASAIRRFRYDPGRRFRSWLISFFHSRVRDVRRASRSPWLELPITDEVAFDAGRPEHDVDEPTDPEIAAMLARAEAVQGAVQARVAPTSWDVFRFVAIEGQQIVDVARSLNREYTTVYRTFTRVSRMINDERKRRETP